MRPTLELLGELAEQTRSLVQIELSLVRAELRERGALISSSATKVGVGLVFLPIGLALIFVALSLALRRFLGPRLSNRCPLGDCRWFTRADLWSQGSETGPSHSLQEHLANLVADGRASGWR
jgi:hypothetical protein